MKNEATHFFSSSLRGELHSCGERAIKTFEKFAIIFRAITPVRHRALQKPIAGSLLSAPPGPSVRDSPEEQHSYWEYNYSWNF